MVRSFGIDTDIVEGRCDNWCYDGSVSTVRVMTVDLTEDNYL